MKYLVVSDCRGCDSRNLDVSPLCNLKNSFGLESWSDAVRQSYDQTMMPDYISSLISPLRKKYATESMENSEMLTDLTKVNI